MPTHVHSLGATAARDEAEAGCEARHDLITVYTCCCGWRAGVREFDGEVGRQNKSNVNKTAVCRNLSTNRRGATV